MILLCKFCYQVFPDGYRSVLSRLTGERLRTQNLDQGPVTGPAKLKFPSPGVENIFSYAEEGLGVDGVSGTAAGHEFSSSFDFCYQQCMGKISEDSTFEPCEH